MSTQTLRMVTWRKNIEDFQNISRKQLEIVFTLPHAPTPKLSLQPTPRPKRRLTSISTPRLLTRPTLALTSVSINDFEKIEMVN